MISMGAIFAQNFLKCIYILSTYSAGVLGVNASSTFSLMELCLLCQYIFLGLSPALIELS